MSANLAALSARMLNSCKRSRPQRLNLLLPPARCKVQRKVALVCSFCLYFSVILSAFVNLLDYFFTQKVGARIGFRPSPAFLQESLNPDGCHRVVVTASLLLLLLLSAQTRHRHWCTDMNTVDRICSRSCPSFFHFFLFRLSSCPLLVSPYFDQQPDRQFCRHMTIAQNQQHHLKMEISRELAVFCLLASLSLSFSHSFSLLPL